MADPLEILFVCMGDVCRSPLTGSVLRHLARERRAEDRFDTFSPPAP